MNRIAPALLYLNDPLVKKMTPFCGLKKGGYHNGKLTLDLFYSRMFIKAYAMGYYYHAQWSNPE